MCLKMNAEHSLDLIDTLDWAFYPVPNDNKP
jgi:hypothetical protein